MIHTLTPITDDQRIHGAHTALQAARAELRTLEQKHTEDTAAGIRVSQGMTLDHAYSVARETATRLVRMLEHDMITACRRYGSAVTRSFPYNAELETIHDNRNPGHNPHARSIKNQITRYTDPLTLESAATLIHAWSEYRESVHTYKDVQRAIATAHRRVQPYIDADRAEEDVTAAWETYRATPGAPVELEPYAWPGGYPLYYVLEQDNETIVLCPTCAADDMPRGKISQETNEEDPDLWCEGCNKRIESAYAEDAPEEHETRLNVWSERDRISVSLEDTRSQNVLLTFWDEAVAEAIESGEIKTGRNARDLESDPVLHASVYEYAKAGGMLERDYTGDRDIHATEDDPKIEQEEGSDPAIAWETFTRRTDGKKLTWIERELDKAGIAHRRNGESWHAPILEIPADRMADAWLILDPFDDIDDNDPIFEQE